MNDVEEGDQEINFEGEEQEDEQQEEEGEEKQTKPKGVIDNMAQFLTGQALAQEEKLEDKLYNQMNKIDDMFIDKPFQKGEVLQVNLKSMVNFRDRLGRTALHVAVAFENKAAVETLLFLNANPLIRDSFGQRPIDLCENEVIENMLRIKMQMANELTLISLKTGPALDGIKTKLISTQNKTKK